MEIEVERRERVRVFVRVCVCHVPVDTVTWYVSIWTIVQVSNRGHKKGFQQVILVSGHKNLTDGNKRSNHGESLTNLKCFQNVKGTSFRKSHDSQHSFRILKGTIYRWEVVCRDVTFWLRIKQTRCTSRRFLVFVFVYLQFDRIWLKIFIQY